MWTLYLLIHVWLTGSIVLPFMLLLRWIAERRGSRWLTCHNIRWILIWACFGMFRILFIAVLLPRFYRNDLLGWDGAAVWNILYAFLIREQSIALEYWIVAAITAILEATIYAVLAAIAWWFFKWATTLKREGLVTETYRVAFLFSACFFGIANNIYSLRPTICSDCFWPHGLPFTFFHEGGFAGGEGFVWSGFLGDAFVILLGGTFEVLVWNWLTRKHSLAKRVSTKRQA